MVNKNELQVLIHATAESFTDNPQVKEELKKLGYTSFIPFSNQQELTLEQKKAAFKTRLRALTTADLIVVLPGWTQDKESILLLGSAGLAGIPAYELRDGNLIRILVNENNAEFFTRTLNVSALIF